MGPEDLAAAAILLGMTVYAALAGADFGGGVWDLLARGPLRAAQRQAIAEAMGPVWEANHVWLIFVVVLLFTCFPAAFAALCIALYVPAHAVLLGIILRGVAFAFRAHHPAQAPRWGLVFGIASLVTPPAMGMTLGALASGGLRIADGAPAWSAGATWLSPLALALGALALALCACLAAVFLAVETGGELRALFRRRAAWSLIALGAAALATLGVAALDAPHLWQGLTRSAWPLLASGAAAGGCAWWSLASGRLRQARAATVVLVACLLGGWGVAQYPYLVVPDVTLAGAAAPRATLVFVLATLPPGLALLLPSLWVLLRVFKPPRATD
jgi:cytochrome d ubiquinol oxidase subunit II